MNKQEIIDYCLELTETYEDYPFDGDKPAKNCTIRHKDNKKIFALITDYEDGTVHINLKCEPLKADFLRTRYEGVIPGYHMNKTHWNTIIIPSDVPEDEFLFMINDSYDLTAKKKK